MKLTFWYWPATNLTAAVAFHRDQLGLLEAWREGSETVAFWLPDRAAQVMVSTTVQPAGPMYLVQNVSEWLAQHPDVVVGVEQYEIPGGSVVGLTGPGDNVFYVFDQPNASFLLWAADLPRLVGDPLPNGVLCRRGTAPGAQRPARSRVPQVLAGRCQSARFTAGDGPTVLNIDGWRLGLGICKDTGAAQHTVGTAALDVDAYVAGLVHQPQELPEHEARAVAIARTCRAYVVFAGFAGPTGDVFARTGGSSAIWSPEGVALARAGPDVGDFTRAVLV